MQSIGLPKSWAWLSTHVLNVTRLHFTLYFFLVVSSLAFCPTWFSGKESVCQCRRPERWVTYSSIPAWKIPRQWNLLVYSPWGHKELDTTKQLSTEDQSTFKPALVTFYQLTPGYSNPMETGGILSYFVSFNLQVSYSVELGVESTLKEIRSVYDLQK